MKNRSIGKVQSKRSKTQWNVKMNHRKLILIFLLFLIPILVLSLHLVSNLIISKIYAEEGGRNMITEFFGIAIPLTVVYDVILWSIIFISITCVMLFLIRSKKKVRKH